MFSFIIFSLTVLKQQTFSSRKRWHDMRWMAPAIYANFILSMSAVCFSFTRSISPHRSWIKVFSLNFIFHVSAVTTIFIIYISLLKLFTSTNFPPHRHRECSVKIIYSFQHSLGCISACVTLIAFESSSL